MEDSFQDTTSKTWAEKQKEDAAALLISSIIESLQENNRDTIVKLPVENQEEDDALLTSSMIKSRKENLELEGRKKFFDLRSQWSFCIIAWITTFIFFHIGLTVFVGRGILNFEKHQFLLPSIIFENFLQIVGMGYIVVKFLYPPTKE